MVRMKIIGPLHGYAGIVGDIAVCPLPLFYLSRAQIITTMNCESPHQAKKCNEAALSLLVCMEKTDCVANKKRGLEECMKDPIESDSCVAVRNAYYNCKHSQLNMRTRIRGVRQY